MVGSDREAFTRWATHRQAALLRTAVLVTGDRQRAEDLVQEALTQVALRWRQLADGHPDAYARQVIVRTNISWWRRRRREVVSDAAAQRGSTRGAERQSESRLALDRALASLTPRQRAVIVLRYYEDLTERAHRRRARGRARHRQEPDPPGAAAPARDLAPSRRDAGGLPMTDQELHDLLHERVADLTMPDVSAAGLGAGPPDPAPTATAAVAGAVAAVGGRRRGRRPAAPVRCAPTARCRRRARCRHRAPDRPRPGPDVARARAATQPDGRYRGWRVYWGPLVAQEATLPRAASPFPDTVDLSAPAPDLADQPIRSALAAYA